MMSEVCDGKHKGHKYLYPEILYGSQKLHKYFSALLIRGTFLLICSYIVKLRNGRKFKCENRPFLVFILIPRRVCLSFFIQFEFTAVGMNST